VKPGALLAGLCVFIASTSSRAQSWSWKTARDPSAARAEQVLIAAERLASHASETRYEPSQRDFRRASVALLELARAEDLPDPRLKFLFAQLLLDVGREERARELAMLALDAQPDSPLAANGWYVAALASAKLGDRDKEYLAYTRALEIEWDFDRRANLYLNRGEAQVTRGDFRAALADYKNAIRLGDGPETQALAYFGLGVALERSGDLPSALDAIATADRILPNALDLPSVFFVPDYEINYYRALGAMAAARSAKPADRRIDLQSAIVSWTLYLERAEPDAQRWVQNARLELSRCERDLARLGR
jgi:tetratricopeptide (TPR) repeat protein